MPLQRNKISGGTYSGRSGFRTWWNMGPLRYESDAARKMTPDQAYDALAFIIGRLKGYDTSGETREQFSAAFRAAQEHLERHS